MTTMTTSPSAPIVPASGEQAQYAGFWAGAWRRFRRNKLALFGMVYVTLIIFVALVAPYITRYTPDSIDVKYMLVSPDGAHWFGTDYLGRDIFTRIVYGARPMLIIGVFSQILGVFIGTIFGLLGGYAGGFVDWWVSRFVLYLVVALSPSMKNIIIALTITSWVGSCRIVRGLSFSIREQDYIVAARALGIPSWRIVLYHVFPQAAPLLIWTFAAGIPGAVLAEASLSFLGMGLPPPTPDWGRMLTDSQTYFQYFPHMLFFPAMAIILTVLAFLGLADGLRQAISVNVNV
jgi:ABC-type dipeptide/oligopeptide/nickel transport system permease subunit